jgi:hypothetical protein
LLKIVFASRLFEQSPKEVFLQAVWFKLLDGLCARTRGGNQETCGELTAVVGARLQQAGQAGCNLASATCSDTCKADVKDFVAKYDCCIKRFVEVDSKFGTAQTIWTTIVKYTEDKCLVPVPDACKGAGRKLVARLVIRNLKFAVWYNMVQAQKALIIAAIKADIAREIGARLDDIEEGQATAATTQSVGANGFVTYAVDDTSTSIDLTITDDNEAAINSMSADLSAAISGGTIAFSQLTAYTVNEGKPEIRANSAEGFTLNVEASSSQVQAGAATQVTGSFVSVFAICLAMILAYFN